MKRSSQDQALAVVVTVAGGIAILYALTHRWNTQEMNPGIEGALTVGIVGPLFLLLHGLRYADVLKGSVAVWAIQYVACQAGGGPAIAVIGIDLVVVGFFGFLKAMTAVEPAPKPERALAPERRQVAAPRHAHS